MQSLKTNQNKTVKTRNFATVGTIIIIIITSVNVKSNVDKGKRSLFLKKS
jgi:hypothetical protein